MSDPLLLESWQSMWRGLGAAGDGAAEHATLLAAYAEPQRHYHTLQHQRECLAAFAPLRALAEDAAALEAGLWFHDAVYELPGQGDNEARSAKRRGAKRAWGGVGVRSSMTAAPGPARPRPSQPSSAAPPTISGKGRPSAKIATKAAASAQSQALRFGTRPPMRQAACSTIAVTAGLMP